MIDTRLDNRVCGLLNGSPQSQVVLLGLTFELAEFGSARDQLRFDLTLLLEDFLMGAPRGASEVVELRES